jgi:hypothetical protein
MPSAALATAPALLLLCSVVKEKEKQTSVFNSTTIWVQRDPNYLLDPETEGGPGIPLTILLYVFQTGRRTYSFI